MNISPQDKAFLITFSSACVLVLVFFFSKLHPYQEQVAAEEFMDIPIIEEPELEEKMEEKEAIAQNEPISHQLKNESRLQTEAEKFFSELDAVREALAQEENAAESDENNEENERTDYQDKIAELRAKIKAAEESAPIEKPEKKETRSSSTARRTTISYILKERNALAIPNPVYTCDAVGKVVINVQVSGNGNVTKTSFNGAASTTSNGCLVEQALSYAKRAMFNDASRSDQLGSITFEFQG
ncbi:hypothetical protein [Flavimarina sp. Hel_I_48]|uniref:hypothetical protein n=1 Tax=Flavimarina sp. Hel_I_48 TaxID=1392488 RepID=UPI0004DECFC5|nr:hypothetical protein [Flavimarina sp. Hel_I_48]